MKTWFGKKQQMWRYVAQHEQENHYSLFCPAHKWESESAQSADYYKRKSKEKEKSNTLCLRDFSKKTIAIKVGQGPPFQPKEVTEFVQCQARNSFWVFSDEI